MALSGGWPAVARSRRRESHLSARWPPAAADDLRDLGRCAAALHPPAGRRGGARSANRRAHSASEVN